MRNTQDPIIRTVREDEVSLLRPCLEGLAAYHNQMAEDFAGVYPTMPIDSHLGHMKEHIVNDTALLLGLFPPEGGLAGFAMASYEGEYGEIDYLFIDESLRDSGFGGQMMEAMLAWLKEKGVTFIDLKVIVGNPAKDFYKNFGFRPRAEVMSLRV